MSGPDPQEGNCFDGTLLSTKTFGVEKNTKPPIPVSLGKAGPFTLKKAISMSKP